MLSCRPHLSIGDWLQKLELPAYTALFKNYNGVEDMLNLSERELKEMGVHIGSHRARLMTSLTVLRKKYEKAYAKVSPNTSSLSLSFENSKSSDSPPSVSHSHMETSGVRSWPSSGSSSLAHTRHSSHCSSMDGGLGTEATAEELKRVLKRELSLDSSDLRSFAWYHGTILRQRAEGLVKTNGDFLVRDCISQPGDFVITCKWHSSPLHFIIKKVIAQQNTIYEKVQYCFENDRFDSISDFITHYVGSRCPLSANSEVIICNPINRVMPLSYYSSRYGVQCQVTYAAKALTKLQSPKQEDNSVLPTLPEKIQIPNKTSNDISITDRSPIQSKSLVRVGSDPSINYNIEKKTVNARPNSGTISTEASKEIAFKIESDKPPPKPSRIPSKRCSQKPLVIKKERKNSPPTPLAVFSEITENFEGSSQLDCFQRLRLIPYKRMISGETRFSFLDHPSVSDDGSETETLNPSFTLPILYAPSCFDPDNFQSTLITNPNKPLEMHVLDVVKQRILDDSVKQLACHLMRVDLEVAKNFEDEDLGLGVTSGLELILLPQGKQLVNDLLERSHCLKLLVAVTILTCSTDERTKLLCKWINIAIETKNACGNFYGFTGIMLGLTMPQILHLDVWHSLRHFYTESAITFETKLIPAFKAMQEASNKVTPNTCIPYIMSLLSILQKHFEILQNNSHLEYEETSFNLGIPSELQGDDFGLQILQNHFDMGRHVLQQWTMFRSNAEITLQNIKYSDEVLDIFRTEFHLRLLWGSRGAVLPTKERHDKYQELINCLYNRSQH